MMPRLQRTGIHGVHEGKMKVDTEYQCKLLLAMVLWQAEADAVVYQRMGLIRDGQAVDTPPLPLDDKRMRLHADSHVDMGEVKCLVGQLKSGYWQRWSDALELHHRVDLRKLNLA